jgi:hypothetical protein
MFTPAVPKMVARHTLSKNEALKEFLVQTERRRETPTASKSSNPGLSIKKLRRKKGDGVTP